MRVEPDLRGLPEPRELPLDRAQQGQHQAEALDRALILEPARLAAIRDRVMGQSMLAGTGAPNAATGAAR